MVESLDFENANFWGEPCGSIAADRLGLDMNRAEDIVKFDDWYFELYPYLKKYLREVVQTGSSCLEVGVGSGTVSRYLSELVPSLDLLDIAPNALSYVKSTMRQELNVNFHCDSVLRFQPGRKYDSIVAIGSLHHSGNLMGAISNLEKLLEPGGKILIMVYYAFQPRRIILHPLRALSEFLSTIRRKDPKYIFEEDDISIRGAADSNRLGEAAPHTVFSSRKLFGQSKDQSKDVVYRCELNNVHRIPLVNRFLSRNLTLRIFSRHFGCDIYAVGVNKIKVDSTL